MAVTLKEILAINMTYYEQNFKGIMAEYHKKIQAKKNRTCRLLRVYGYLHGRQNFFVQAEIGKN